MDWNSDGRRDLLCGDRGGYLNVFIQTDAGLVPYLRLRKQNGDTIDVGTNSCPTVIDWNSDGRKDVVISRESAITLLFLNIGSDTWPVFQDSIILTVGGSWLVFSRGQPRAYDLDQDGRQDLIYGEMSGYIHFLRNLGPDSFATLARPETLRTVTGSKITPPGSPARESKVGLCDWNNDGTPDLLVGGYSGLIDLYLGVPQVGLAEDAGNRISEASFRLWPNPARAKARIRFSSLAREDGCFLRLYNALGCCVQSVSLTPTSARTENSSVLLDLRGLAAGVYLAYLEEPGRKSAQKLVVEE